MNNFNVEQVIENNRERLIDMSKFIWKNPELGYQEIKASDMLIKYLQENQFEVIRNVLDMKTAFIASYSSKKKGPTVGVISEYDALTNIGHACGHNLFSVAAVGSAVALKTFVEENGGTIKVIGTPAEEGTVPNAGAKVIMADAGIFDDLDMAIMCHSEGKTIVKRNLVASAKIDVDYYGKAAHAGGDPEEGKNALMAAVLTINNINGMRQQFAPRTIVNPIITQGGYVASSIPDKAQIKLSTRMMKIAGLNQLNEKIRTCVEAACMVTGCTYDFKFGGNTYEDIEINDELAKLFAESLDEMGVPYIYEENANFAWDIGNVSHRIPVVCPYIKIGDESLVCHTTEFLHAANSNEGFEGMLIGAKAMSLTVIKFMASQEIQDMVKKEFTRTKNSL